MDGRRSRRDVLAALATIGTAGLAGCSAVEDAFDGTGGGPAADAETATPTTSSLDDVSVATADGDGATPTDQYARVYDAVAPSVCSVVVYDGGGRSGQGSAFVYDDGHLVTNEHVVSEADGIYVRFAETGWVRATVRATDVYSDLAVLSVSDRPETATPLSFVEREPAVGTEVVAIGNPFGYAGTVSAGIVSGVDRTLRAANDFSIPDAVQTDAAVNPGNSGGPLVALDGDVVGVVNAGGGDNIGFAISAALTQEVVPALLEDGEYEHTYLGVRLQSVTPTIARANGLSRARGVYIDEVVDGGPADGTLQGSTGQRSVDGVTTPVGGDVVVAIDGTQIPERQTLSSYLALETGPGETVDVTVLRDGSRQTVSFELGARPDPEDGSGS